MSIKLLKLVKTPLKVGFLYTKVVNLLFSRLILTSRNEKVLLSSCSKVKFLKFASDESFFIFDNEYYCQLDGVAMGSPLGPTLANAFLCHFEKQCLTGCQNKSWKQ